MTEKERKESLARKKRMLRKALIDAGYSGDDYSDGALALIALFEQGENFDGEEIESNYSEYDTEDGLKDAVANSEDEVVVIPLASGSYLTKTL
jgi:hypothetical protein